MNFLPRLLHLYQEEPDAGIHGAAEWLLRRWQAGEELKRIDQALATGKVEGTRLWYINRQGQTMMLMPPVDTFWMGDGKDRHQRKIGHSFAIASKEVTVAQFLRFRKDHDYKKEMVPKTTCPVNKLTWYDAVAYCNWLNEQEGIPPERWCYLPNEAGKYAAGMKLRQ